MLRNSIREFRLDKIESLRLTADKFEHFIDFDLSKYFDEMH